MHKSVNPVVIKAALLIAAAVLGLMIFHVSLAPIRGTDAYRHIHMGKLILNNQTLSFAEDPLLFVAEYKLHDQTYSLNWLFQVLVYGMYRFTGFTGLCLLQVILAVATFYFLVRAAGQVTVPGLLLFILATYAYRQRVEIRPHLVSYLLLAVFIFLIWHTDLRRLRHILPLVILQFIWANTHLYFFLGPLVVLLYWGERIIYRDITPRQQLRVFLVLTGLSAVSLVNPMGFRVYQDVAAGFFAFFNHNSYFVAPGVLELMSPFDFSGFNRQLYLGSVILTSGGCVLSIISKRKKKYLFVFLFLLSYSFYSARAAMIFILLSPVFLSQDLKVFYDIMTRKYHNQLTRLKESPGFTVAGIIAFTIVISLTVWPQADRLADRLAESGFGLTNLSEPDVPDLSLGAIDFINRYPGIIPKRMFTSYNNGSAYTFFTGRPAFIDSRGISSEFFQEYMRITNPAYVPRNDFKLLVDKYNLEGFISRVINVNLLRKLYLDGRYEPVYIDKQMVICLRNDTVTDTQWQGLRQRFRDELENQVLVLQPSGPSAVDLDLINMAAALISLEQTDAALAILTRCAARSPTTFAAQYNAGMGFLKKNDCAQAYEYFRRALILEPASIPALAAASITAEPAGRGDSGVAYAALLRAKTTPELREKIKHHYALLGLPISLSLEP